MNLFEQQDYRTYLRSALAARAQNGRGELLRVARFAGIHSSVLSQVFQGKRELTSEQAVAVAQYLELSEPESHYFLLLTQLARAGSERLRQMLQGQLEKLRQAQTQISERVRPSRPLTNAEKSIFYSNWFYSAVRLLSAVPGLQTKDALRKRLGLPADKFRAIVSFLVEHGLCVEKDGKLSPGPHWTHLEGDSPLVARHHANWRVKAMEKHPAMNLERELAFTSPMALSKADAQKIRAKLLDCIDEVCKKAGPSPSETVYCLNVDWLEI